jgi:hypothetical protein
MKLASKALTVIDYTALGIALLSVVVVVVACFISAIVSVTKEIARMWSNGSDHVLCVIILISFGWCAVRWKKLNSRE